MASLGAISFLVAPAAFAEEPAPAQAPVANSTAVVVDGVVSTTPIAVQTPAVTAETSSPKLPYGVEDVLKLSRARVSEDITLSYIQTSGTIYNLGPKDIVYLKEQGVSDKVVNAMLEQRKKALEAAAQTAAAAAAQGAVPADGSVPVVTAPLTPIYQTAPTYVEPAPDYVPASTLYVIPYPAARYAYYGGYSYPTYYNYCSPYRYYGSGYCAPSVVVHFGGGGHGRGGYTHSFHHR